MEDAYKNKLMAQSDESRRAIARQAFDRHAKSAYENAHPLLRAKFPSPQRLPFYNMLRERAAFEGADVVKRISSSGLNTSARQFPRRRGHLQNVH
jgi:hypothetical protein